MILKPGMKHQREELYKVYINHGPGMILTCLMARSTKGAHAFEWGTLSKCHLKGKLMILKINEHQGHVCPHAGTIYMYITIIIFKDLL